METTKKSVKPYPAELRERAVRMVREADDWARRYRELETQLAELGDTNQLAREAGTALKRGELEMAGAVAVSVVGWRRPMPHGCHGLA